MARKKYIPPPGQPWGTGKKAVAVILAIIGIMGLLITISSWGSSDASTQIVGILMMILPIGLAMGLSSGTGRPMEESATRERFHNW